MSRGPFRNSRFHHPHAPSSKRKACKIYWFSLRFKHIEKFEAISTKPPLTAPQPQALFNNSPRKINVFLAEIYWCFRDYEQRHRRRATHFARATPPQTDYMFWWNRERHWGYKHFFLEERKGERVTKHGVHFAVDKLTQIARAKKKNENGRRRATPFKRPVRFAADVRQKCFGISRGEFWWAIKKLRLYWFYWCFWELYKKWIFELEGWRTCFGTDLPCRWITYIKYS